MLASNNPFPSVLFLEEASAPANPTAGQQRLFLDSATHHLKRVNSSGAVTDIESLAAVLTINAQTGTAYTLVAGDAGAFVTMTNAAASTLTVPPNSSVAFAVGTRIEGAQLGAGQVTLTPGAGVTINGTPGLRLAAQYGTFGLIKTATDTWLAYGRLSA